MACKKPSPAVEGQRLARSIHDPRSSEDRARELREHFAQRRAAAQKILDKPRRKH